MFSPEMHVAVAAAARAAVDRNEAAPREAIVVVPMTSAVTPATPAFRAADNVTIEDAAVQPVESIENVLRRLILHEDRPIENLPEMVSSELKLIGRCVSLRVKQTIGGINAPYYYTGLVSMVTDTAVTLMYVCRYTAVDFSFYQTRERRIADVASSAGYPPLRRRRELDIGDEDAVQRSSTVSQKNGGDSEGASSSTGRVTEAEGGDAVAGLHSRPDAAGSLAPALCLSLEPAEASPTADTEPAHPRSARPKRFRLCTESLAILPYVTLLRANIDEVAFGRDPTSDFYALFHDPSRQLMDMQFLRTFVRRYLVHTSEHNNPRQVPMYTFVTDRGGCPDLDRGLANQLVREELPRLMQADRAIAKEKRRRRNRAARLQTAVQEYRAPPGPFVNTGVLYLTQIPQQTFMSASVTLVFTAGFVVFLLVSLSTLRDSLVRSFMAGFLKCFVPSILVWTMAGVLTFRHAVSMRLPVQQDLPLLAARTALSVGAAACAIAAIAVITNNMSNERIYEHLYKHRHGSLCAFYKHHQCSGFYYPCSDAGPTNPLCNSCAIHYPERECFVDIWSRLQFTTMPLLLFCVFVLLSSVNGLMLVVKLYLVSRSMTAAIIA
ncbi:hypothetical protein ABB37_09476 [Leptomonas pyrrhocoris]|uniref:Uncharacterized protein n=1 Tax=Leptomonas pyrrhocoris TaxID=157538 RepID=A0A0N0VCY4_LEPPY|nr:hypothetical protein ABB37_09476 [Leptomonas pyrrhocoris]KPA73832.1 hypothetical protein ABB37_09476 [Leptomonas pyrrhocoris]|eukprot:XP_015652271.1 hypothetical protein ABB37_09476 [Leptomonas pyrrhocoris]